MTACGKGELKKKLFIKQVTYLKSTSYLKVFHTQMCGVWLHTAAYRSAVTI
jgi:hypothetical protein